MKVFSVCGITKSGKTTTIEQIIRELTARGYRVGSVKEIHFEAFAIDPDPSKNTARHRRAGSRLVTARGINETDVMFPEMLSMNQIFSFYHDFDYVVLEGISNIPVPMIITAYAADDLDARWNDLVFCVSGKIADEMDEYKDIPAISAVTDAVSITNLVMRKVYDLLPDIDPKCCRACGWDCRELGVKILKGEAQRGDCVADKGAELYIDGKRIVMAPFVQKVLRGTVLGVVSELDGFQKGAEISVKFR